jgi:uncharacterized protein (DUF952 family)
MRLIFHIVFPADYERQRDGDYCADSLASEGFIHCSNRDQVAWVANQFYAQCPELWLLYIHADRLTSSLRDEDVGTGERFPHVYGPIDHDAILEVQPMQRRPDGRWLCPTLPIDM